jgi:hypothetical protein
MLDMARRLSDRFRMLVWDRRVTGAADAWFGAPAEHIGRTGDHMLMPANEQTW